MKTLIIVSHPSIEESETQQFFKAAATDTDVTWHHLETCYPDFKIDRTKELALLAEHQRIIFQFPFYWYSAPAHLKLWEDQILDKAGNLLKNKELGLVVTTGVAQQHYQAGGNEAYTLSEFLRPYQGIANKLGMNYLRPFICAQFPYQSEQEHLQMLVAYQQYLTLDEKNSLLARSKWQLERLTKMAPTSANPQQFSLLLDVLEENNNQIEELSDTLGLMKEEGV